MLPTAKVKRKPALSFPNKDKALSLLAKIAPPGLWENMSPQIKSMRGKDSATEKVVIAVRNTSLDVTIFPGHQDDILNNVYAITLPEGKTVMHTGDQYNEDDMGWINRVGDEVKVDVLLVHSWMSELEKSVKGIRPDLIIVGHQNEMEHTIDHRESYGLTFRNFKDVPTLYVVVTWGECYTVGP